MPVWGAADAEEGGGKAASWGRFEPSPGLGVEVRAGPVDVGREEEMLRVVAAESSEWNLEREALRAMVAVVMLGWVS